MIAKYSQILPNLQKGIYIDREYPIEIEFQCKALRPILTAARKIPSLKKKCKLEGATLKIKGKRYNLKTLHKLPPELDVFKLSSKTNEETNVVGFFGQLNPLSNFHYAPFKYNGINFHSSKQLIQYQKSLFAKDTECCNRILATDTAIECKLLSSKIQNLDAEAWDDTAKEACKPGIRCKFQQNPILMDCLLNTGDKTIVECAKDVVWGNGVPLAMDHCLDSTKWLSQGGILGEILTEIREEEKSNRTTQDAMMMN